MAEWNTKTSVTLWTSRDRRTTLPAPQGHPSGGSAQRLTFSPDSSRLGFIENGVIRIVDVDSCKQVLEVKDPGLAPKFVGWALLSKDSALALSTEDYGSREDCRVQVSTIALTSAKAKFTEQLVTKGFDGEPALGPHGVVVNRGVFLERTDAPRAEPVAGPPVVWVEGSASKQAPPTSSKATKKPTLHLPAAALGALKKHCTPAFEVLSAHAELSAFAPKSPLADRALAEAAAKPLKGVVLSSDIDWDFIPCVFEGEELRGSNVKVVKPVKKLGADRLLSDLMDIASVDEYLSPEDQEAHKKAAKVLESASPVRQLRLTDDDKMCTVLLTLARTTTGSPGLLTVRIDT